MSNEELQKKVRYALLIIIVLCTTFLAGYNICLRGIHDNGSGIDSTRNELNHAESEQRAITGGITDAENGAGEIEKRIDTSTDSINRATDSASRIETTITDSGNPIADSQQIIANIRARGKQKISDN